MDSKQLSNDKLTDPVGEESKSKKRPGKASKQKRQDAYRRKKNVEADNAILAGVFARLKITDPTAITSLSLAKETHPVTVPVAFSEVPHYVDRVWDTMEAIGTRPFGRINTPTNKAIFKKGVLMLNEVKVCYAQRAHVEKPDEDLPTKRAYTLEQLNDLNNMAENLPMPIALQLETVGNCVDQKQSITPILAEISGSEQLSGALTYAPNQLLPLLEILHIGVPANDVVHKVAQQLSDLPMMDWEEYQVPAQPPAPPQNMVKITEACYDFWISNHQIRWSDYI